MNLKELEKDVHKWNDKNFGEQTDKSGYRNLLGVAEEVGELCHAHLKGEQGIRHTPDEILEMKKDAIGDIVIFLINYAKSQNLSVSDCIEHAWSVVKNRDWTTKDNNKNEKKLQYKIYTIRNLADTMRDPDEIIIEILGYKSDLSEAQTVAKDYIKTNFFHKNTKLTENKDGTYSATDFCSYGATIMIEPCVKG